MTRRIYRPDQKHPPESEQDLNPNALAGQNWRHLGEKPGRRNARDFKDAHRALRDFPDDFLAQIPIVPAGERLEQGGTYVNLVAVEPQPFTATGDESVGPDDLVVHKQEVAYQIWNRLIGVDNPDRLT